MKVYTFEESEISARVAFYIGETPVQTRVEFCVEEGGEMCKYSTIPSDRIEVQKIVDCVTGHDRRLFSNLSAQEQISIAEALMKKEMGIAYEGDMDKIKGVIRVIIYPTT